MRNDTAELLIEAYSDDASIRVLLPTASLKPQVYNFHGSVRDIWYRIVDDLGPSGSEQLIGAALEDPTVENFYDQFRELKERLTYTMLAMMAPTQRAARSGRRSGAGDVTVGGWYAF